MTCTELRSSLDPYLRGALSATESEAIELHAAECAVCGDLLDGAHLLSAEVRALPKSVLPVVDLWPGIQARLDRGGRGIRRRYALPAWALAAAAVVLVALSSGTTALLTRGATPRLVADLPSERIRGLEAQYAAASDELGRTLTASPGKISQETMLILKKSLTTIDSALAESRRALARDPANASLEQLVLAAWRQKLDLLRRATTLAGAGAAS
ncbi:MAG: hypothetical protein HOP28_06250 [Gemmatimonadales bacterium]|nr:hypothetical protein [Gemmatimonadales bacterium]